jgi:hypothetical protein
MQQVHEAQHYIERAGKLGHPSQFQTLDRILEFLLYFRGALNSYGKCFVSSGRGKMKLEKTNVFSTSSELLGQHERIMELRHKYVAHSDNNEIEKASFEYTDTPAELVVQLQYNFSFPFDRLYELRALIQHLADYVVDSHKKHLSAIEREIGKPVRIQEGN